MRKGCNTEYLIPTDNIILLHLHEFGEQILFHWHNMIYL